MALSAAPAAVAPVGQPTAPLSVKAVLPWAVFFGVLMMTLIYFVGAEQGAVSLISGENVHEWVHDGRHLLGFPCH